MGKLRAVSDKTGILMVKASPLIRDSRIVRDRYSGDVDGRPNIQVRVVVKGASTRKPIWNAFASFICSRDIRSNDVGASLNAYCSNSISILGIGSPFRVRISGIATIGPTEDILNTTGVIKNVSAAKATIMSRMRRIFTDILLPNVRDHRHRTAGAPSAGSVATKHSACQRVGVRWIALFGIFYRVVSFAILCLHRRIHREEIIPIRRKLVINASVTLDHTSMKMENPVIVTSRLIAPTPEITVMIAATWPPR